MTNLMAKSIDAYNNFFKSGQPSYVIKAFHFLNSILPGDIDNRDELIKVFTIKLIMIHLNGKAIILDDEYVKLCITLKDTYSFIKVTSRPTLIELLNSFDISNEYERSIIAESFINQYIKTYESDPEFIKSISELKSFSTQRDKASYGIKPIY